MSNSQTSSKFNLEFRAAGFEQPHSMPQLATQPQLAANHDDIAALIAEISASATDNMPSAKMEHDMSEPETLSKQPSRGQQNHSQHQKSHQNSNGHHKEESEIQNHIVSKRARMTTKPYPSSSPQNTTKESGITSSPHEQIEANKTISRDSKQTDSGDAVHVVDPEDAELHEWLVYTNWFDLEYRARFLARRRKIADLHNQQLQLIEEEAKSLSRQKSANSAGPFPAASIRASAAPRPPGRAHITSTSNEAKAKSLPLVTRSIIPAKREHDEEKRPERAEKSARDSLSHDSGIGQQTGGKHDHRSYRQQRLRSPGPARQDARRRVEFELRSRKSLDLGRRGG